jgi:hypothetical protein
MSLGLLSSVFLHVKTHERGNKRPSLGESSTAIADSVATSAVIVVLADPVVLMVGFELVPAPLSFRSRMVGLLGLRPVCPVFA